MGRLDGKIAIITGGGSGIGRATAELFVQEGAKVVITGRTEEKLQRTVEATGGRAVAMAMDVSKPGDCERVIADTADRLGVPTILVNNAGMFEAGAAVHEITVEAWDKMMAVNLRGPFLMTRAIIPLLIEAGGGSIVNIGSILGTVAVPQTAHYNASKAGLTMLTRSTAIDYGSKGIRCNMVCPGLTKTPMTKELRADEEMVGQILQDYPLGRFGEPRDLAPAVLHFASDESGWTTGSVLMVDGGMTAQ